MPFVKAGSSTTCGDAAPSMSDRLAAPSKFTVAKLSSDASGKNDNKRSVRPSAVAPRPSTLKIPAGVSMTSGVKSLPYTAEILSEGSAAFT